MPGRRTRPELLEPHLLGGMPTWPPYDSIVAKHVKAIFLRCVSAVE
jgi:hypothetical protein